MPKLLAALALGAAALLLAPRADAAWPPLPWLVRDAAAPADHDAGFWVYGQVAAGFSGRFADAGDASRFDLGRAEVGLAWLGDAPDAGLVLQLDGVRSADPESLLGVDGNALVLTLSRAFGVVRGRLGDGAVTVTGRLGIVPDPFVAAAEEGYDLRAVASVLADSGGFFDRADLGAGVRVGLLDDAVTLDLAAMNGEGASQLELDDRLNVHAQLEVVPWRPRFLGGEGRLALVAAYRDGTRGAGGARDDRFAAAVTFTHPRLGVGVETALAWGFAQRGDRDALGVAAWARGEIVPRYLGLYARYDWQDLDRAADDAVATRLHVGVTTDLPAPDGVLGRLRVFVGYRAERFGGSAGAVPGVTAASDADVVLVGIEAVGVAR